MNIAYFTLIKNYTYICFITRKTFNKFDDDGNGEIDVDEFGNLGISLNYKCCENLDNLEKKICSLA